MCSAAWIAGSIYRFWGFVPEGGRVEYCPRPDATPENEARALADAYAFLIGCAEREEDAGTERSTEDERQDNSSGPGRARGDETEGDRARRPAGGDQHLVGVGRLEPTHRPAEKVS